MKRYASRLLGAVTAAAGLAACSGLTGPSDAYWQNQAWDAKLFQVVQSAVHYPLDARGQPIGEPASVHGKVEFTYSDGKILDPEMAQSTGRPDLDAAMLQQVATASVPPAIGSHAREPHAFALALSMLAPMEMFEQAMLQAINAKKVYPREAIIHGDQGVSTIGFDYRGGQAYNIRVLKSSGTNSLDAAAMMAVANARMPASPAWLNTETGLHLSLGICYSLGNSSRCPPLTRQVIEVENTPGTQVPAPPSKQ